MPPRIAYIISQYPEFHETFIAREVEALRSKGMPPRIFSLKTPPDNERNLYPQHADFVEYSPYLVSFAVIAANLFEALQYPWRYLAALRWVLINYCNRPLKLLKALAAFPKTVLYARKIRGNYDLLHAHWATIPAGMAVVINILTKVKFSITAHAWDIFLASPSLLREKIARSCGIVTCTGYNANYLRQICSIEDRDKVLLNYHGLDFSNFPEQPTVLSAISPYRILAVGRMVEQKGFVHLIHAAALLAEKGMVAHITIIGDGPLREELEKEAEQIPKGVTVEFPGRVSHCETIVMMRSSHLFVAPSVISKDGDRDGIPNVILEAMACGIPVIGSNVSGIPEVVIHGQTGCLVPPADPAALAEAFSRLANDQHRAREMGQNGRRFVEKNFDITRNIEELIGYFGSFAGTGRSGEATRPRLTYIVSMFPCWSETFILNELVDHDHHGIKADVFSLKACNESMVHEEAKVFIPYTTYGREFINLQLVLQHAVLITSSPLTYARALLRLLRVKFTDHAVKGKAMAIFAMAPDFILTAKKNRSSHLHAHFATYPALLAWLIHQFTNIPYTFTAHAHDIYYNQDLLPLICSDAAQVITISEFNKKFIDARANMCCSSKINVIHCGIDVNKFSFNHNAIRDSDHKTLKILSIGRLTGIKGFPYLIEALRMLREEGIDFTCDILGDGPLRDSLQRQIRDAGLPNHVRLLGSKKSDEIPEYLYNSDLFVLACATDKKEIHDGIPVVFMEAMAYGTPVIGTSLSGIPELIRHGVTGLCARPEDARDIYDTIRHFISNRQQAEDMRRNARKLVEGEFNIAITSRQLREMFTQRQDQKTGTPA